MKKVACSVLTLVVGFGIATEPAQANWQQQQPPPASPVPTNVQSGAKSSGNGAAISPERKAEPAANVKRDDQSGLAEGTSGEDTGRAAQPASEEEAVQSYYEKVLATYRLAPEDVISVSVFGLERYSKSNITVPPNGKISYPLIPDGVRVIGKTTEELQDEFRKKLEEYIIDPKITVTLDQARSTRYSILGDVRAPGVKPMLRRLTVLEALADAGGVLDTGSKKNVVVLRRQPNGLMDQIPVNISKIEKGRAADIIYLEPGDQIIVPGNTLKKIREITSFASVLSFARIFRIF